MEQNENILLTNKLEMITTGKPWRIWMALKGLNPTYMKKSIARREFNKSIESIKRRSNNDVILENDVRREEMGVVPEHYESLHPLHKEIQKVNYSMPSKGLKHEGEWIVDELNICLKGECYGIASGLVEYLLVNYKEYELDLKHRILPMVFETLLATGDKERIISLFVRYADDLPKSDRIASIAALIFPSTTLGSNHVLLPSGRINALSLNKRIESGTISSEDILSISVEHRKQLIKNPQLYLLLHNSVNKTNTDISHFALNELYTSYKLPKIEIQSGNENILERLSFKTDYLINDGPLVSIIMSAYKARNTIEYAIRSLLVQTYQNIEILICDDNSKDIYFEDIQTRYSNHPKIRFFRSKNNQGTYNIRNSMIQEAKGELITFQDSDDYSLPTRIESQVDALSTGNNIACITRWLRVKPNGHFVFFRDQAALRMCVVSLMVPKNIFEMEGSYRSTMFGADTEFYEHLRQTYGDSHIAKLKAPQILGLWSSRSMTRSNGSEALEDGYRAYPRQVYAESAFQQRFLGKDIITDEKILEKLIEIGNYRSQHGVIELKDEKL